MTTTDAEDWFVDTNILIYATNAQSPWHQHATAALNNARQQGVNFVISPQILREYLVTATRSAPTPLLRSAVVNEPRQCSHTDRHRKGDRKAVGLPEGRTLFQTQRWNLLQPLQ
jgi:predicted nucleic acid-binding protein